MRTNNRSLVFIAGVVFGLSGFTLVFADAEESFESIVIRTAFVVFGTFILIASLTLKISQKYGRGILAILTYLAFYLLSNAVNQISITDILREILLVIVALALYVLLSDEEACRRFVNGLYYSLITLVIYGATLVEWDSFFSRSYRLESNFGSNSLGMMASSAFVLAYVNFSQKIGWWNRILDAIVLLLAIGVVVATRSRTSLIMLFISFLLLAWLYNHKLAIIATVIGCGGIVFYNFDIIDAVLRISELEGVSTEKSIYNLTGRTDVWLRGVHVIAENVFFGVGPLAAYTDIDGHQGTYHNAFIQLMVTVGLVGALPIVFLIINGVRNAWRETNNCALKIIFFSGLIGAIAESRLLNYGSPANLLFFLSVLYFSHAPKLTKQV